jgi:ABC-type lipoprotein export system ATPase subunit/ABC-type antimicrobial peptide transport system permease subunit
MFALEHLSRKYITNGEEHYALKDVSLTLPDTGLVVILGPSGSGKTTLLNLLGALDRPSEGSILFLKKDIAKFSAREADFYRREDVGFIYQDYNLLPKMSVLKNVLLPTRYGSFKTKKENEEKAKNLLNQLGLGDKLEREPSSLSGGERQRVAIARALINDPLLLLADEPTGSLDEENSLSVMEELARLKQDHLILLVTHNTPLAQHYADRLIHLKDGQIVADETKNQGGKQTGKPQENKKHPFSFLSGAVSSLKQHWGKSVLLCLISTLGIASVATTLALKEGTDATSKKIEGEALSSMPLTLYNYTVGSLALDSNVDQTGFYPDDGHIEKINATPNGLLHVNNFTASFFEENATVLTQSASRMETGYAFLANILSEKKDGSYSLFGAEANGSASNYISFFLGSSSIFSPLLTPEERVAANFDYLEGHYPTGPEEALVVLDRRNGLPAAIYDALALADSASVKDVMGASFKAFDNEDFYSANSSTTAVTGYFLKSPSQLKAEGKSPLLLASYLAKAAEAYGNGDTATRIAATSAEEALFNDSSETRKLKSFSSLTSQSDLAALYQDPQKGSVLKIAGVVRPKLNAYFQDLPGGIYLSKDFVDAWAEKNENSALAQEVASHILLSQKNNVLAIPDIYTYENSVTLESASGDETTALKNILSYLLSRASLGSDKTINALYYYSPSLKAKNQIIAALDAYNAKQSDFDTLVYTDVSGSLLSAMNHYLGIVESVFLALAGFAFLFSAFLIALTMTNDVKENAKEIGLYRSFGFPKSYVASLYLGKAGIIAVFAILIGLLFAGILCFPLNAFLGANTPGVDFTHFASLSLVSSLWISLLAILSHLFGALFPAVRAVNLDPIKTLKSE